MKFYGLVQIRPDTPLFESICKVVGKVVDRRASTRMVRGIELQCSSIEFYGLVEVRRDAPLLESGFKAQGKVVERCGSIRMAGGTTLQGYSTLLHIVCHFMLVRVMQLGEECEDRRDNQCGDVVKERRLISPLPLLTVKYVANKHKKV